MGARPRPGGGRSAPSEGRWQSLRGTEGRGNVSGRLLSIQTLSNSFCPHLSLTSQGRGHAAEVVVETGTVRARSCERLGASPVSRGRSGAESCWTADVLLPGGTRWDTSRTRRRAAETQSLRPLRTRPGGTRPGGTNKPALNCRAAGRRHSARTLHSL